MTNTNNQNNSTNMADVFTGQNGPVLGGILGIIFLVGIHYVITGDYRLSVKSGEKSIDLMPAAANVEHESDNEDLSEVISEESDQ